MVSSAQPVKFSAQMGAGCEAESWSPEVVSLYGDGATVMQKLQNFDMSLPKRRIYVSLIESDGDAEVSLFERYDGNIKVSRWRGAPQKDLRLRLDDAILENKSVHCVGEQTKSIQGACLVYLQTRGSFSYIR